MTNKEKNLDNFYNKIMVKEIKLQDLLRIKEPSQKIQKEIDKLWMDCHNMWNKFKKVSKENA